MKHAKHDALGWIVLLVACTMLAGGVTSIMLTQNPDWMSLHLSRLGEGGQLSSYVFNATVALSGLIMFELATRLGLAHGWVAISPIAARRARWVIAVAFRAIAVCLVGLSIFPYDKFVVFHNILGYGMTAIYLLTVAYLTYIPPLFERKFQWVVGIFLLAMLGFFAFYFIFNGRQVTLIQTQLLGLIFFYVWLVRLVRALR